MAEDAELAETLGSPNKSTFFKFLDSARGTLDEKLERFRPLSPAVPLVDEEDVTTDPARPRGGSVVVLEDPRTHQRTGSDDSAQQDVIRLLKQCLAAANVTEEELRSQLAQLEKDVEFWKRESYSGISVTLEAISVSPQYKELKEKHRLAAARARELEAELNVSRQDSVVSDQGKLDEMIVLRKEIEKFQDKAKSWETQMAAQKKQVENGESRALELTIARENDALRAEQFSASLKVTLEATQKELAEARECNNEGKKKEAKLAAEIGALRERLEARERTEVGSEELHTLQRDRRQLASELAEAREELAAMKGEKSAENRRQDAERKTSDAGTPVREEDAALQKRFKLERNETILSNHGAAVSGQHGFAWLTKGYILFGSSAVQSFYDQRDVRVPLENVAVVDRLGQGKLELRDAAGIALVQFGGIRSRNQLAEEILGAMQAMGAPPPMLLTEGSEPENVNVAEGADDFVLVDSK